MSTEIERKFLVKSGSWREGPPGTRICQGYLCRDPERTVRVRVKGEKGYLTVKGATRGIERREFEYPVPREDAEALLAMCRGPLLEKIRYERRVGRHLWEIDEFAGGNEGLILAEIELAGAGEEFEMPEWAGAEVSEDPRYYNACLAERPWREWGAEA